jgi:hypothetical protein
MFSGARESVNGICLREDLIAAEGKLKWGAGGGMKKLISFEGSDRFGVLASIAQK